jgi:hypothetical protein
MDWGEEMDGVMGDASELLIHAWYVPFLLPLSF